MNNNELRLQELTREIALFEHLILPTMPDTNSSRATIIKKDTSLHLSKYYSTYIQLIEERNQLLKTINGEEIGTR